MREQTITDAMEGRHRPRPHPLSVEEARKLYHAHSPSMHTHICLGCFGQVPWPCRLYREAHDVLLLAGELQAKPVQPSL